MCTIEPKSFDDCKSVLRQNGPKCPAMDPYLYHLKPLHTGPLAFIATTSSRLMGLGVANSLISLPGVGTGCGSRVALPSIRLRLLPTLSCASWNTSCPLAGVPWSKSPGNSNRPAILSTGLAGPPRPNTGEGPREEVFASSLWLPSASLPWLPIRACGSGGRRCSEACVLISTGARMPSLDAGWS